MEEKQIIKYRLHMSTSTKSKVFWGLNLADLLGHRDASSCFPVTPWKSRSDPLHWARSNLNANIILCFKLAHMSSGGSLHVLAAGFLAMSKQSQVKRLKPSLWSRCTANYLNSWRCIFSHRKRSHAGDRWFRKVPLKNKKTAIVSLREI